MSSNVESEPYIVSITRWLYRWIKDHDRYIDNTDLTKVSDAPDTIPEEIESAAKSKETIAKEKDLNTISSYIQKLEGQRESGKLTEASLKQAQTNLDKIAKKYKSDEEFASYWYVLIELQFLIYFIKGDSRTNACFTELCNSIPKNESFISASAYLFDNELSKRRKTRDTNKIKRLPLRLFSLRESLIILCVVLIGTSLVWNRVTDWYTIETASPSMIKLAEQAHMSTKGEVLFLRTHPQIDSPDQFDTDCDVSSTNNDGISVLGCYIPGKNKIYILSMPSSLHEVEVSTAAYELLHPVYLQLSSTSQKSQLNNIIEINYLALNGDQNLNDQVSTFAATEPGDRDNELFSILGTEYNGSITNNLLHYYQPYFTDGLDAVNSDYNQVQQTISGDAQRLNDLRDSYNNDIKYSSEALNYYDKAYYDASTWIGIDESEFEDNMNIANQDYNNYSSDIDDANSAVSQYNQLLSTYNNLVNSYTGGQQVNQLSNVQTQPEGNN